MTNEEILSRNWKKIENYLIQERNYCPIAAKKTIITWSKKKTVDEKKRGPKPSK